MDKSSTTISSWALVIARALESYDCDVRSLFSKAGVDLEQVNDPEARFPVERMTRLWQLAVAATNDPCVGLTVSRFVHPTTLHALGFALMASESLKDALNRTVRYYRLVSDAAELKLCKEGDQYQLIFHCPEDKIRPSDESIDAFMATAIALLRSLYRADFHPVKVTLQRVRPVCSEKFDQFFAVPVQFSANDNILFFDGTELEVKLPTANAELARLNDQVMAQYLARFEQGNIVNQVRVKLTELLPTGELSQEAVAKSMNMSLRSLQRKLKEENISYSHLLDDIRKELAVQYIRQPNLSLTTITYILGFSDPSNFTRAFRRWTGMSPSEYRKDK